MQPHHHHHGAVRHTLLLLSSLTSISLVLVTKTAAATGATGWLLPSAELERESSEVSSHSQQQTPAILRSPAFIAQQHQNQYQQINGRSSYLFSRNNGRFWLPPDELRQTNLFQCVEPTRSLYENFARQYNRTYLDASEKLERLQLFAVSLKRAIVLNRVIQSEIMNSSMNLATRNYHFVEPVENRNLALWYADVTDCELALLKNVLLDVFHFVDENKHHVALRIVQDQGKSELPGLLNSDGFEQLANILLVRLFDRFRGDDKMNQLFEWPMYLKRVASFAYSQQQAQQPDFKTKLRMVAFAYPAYFKDLKYNHPAINRTHDNVKANQAHKEFNEANGRRVTSIKALNRRLNIFRQRWSLVNLINEDLASELNSTARHIVPDWLRVQQYEQQQQSPTDDRFNEDVTAPSGRLRLEASSDQNEFGVAGLGPRKPHQLTQFSDLTDTEFQAFLSNDYSLLNGNKESAEFLDSNFPLRPLDEPFRWELAHELELRHGMTLGGDTLDLLAKSGELQLQNNNNNKHLRPSLRLAKQVIDELIGDVGLPIGPAALEGIADEEHVQMFQRVATFFAKPYLAEPGTSNFLGSQLTNVDLLEERHLRLARFKENYARFRAWFIKENWHLSDAQQVALLRLADMSWLEIKFTMFKVCCLTSDNIIALSSTNATLQYLGSNYDLLCGESQLGAADVRQHVVGSSASSTGQTGQSSQQQQQQSAANELAASEIYYYYLVHFNKHHQNRAEFARRFNIFRRNIDSIRRHSCKRSLTLFESLKNKRADLLSTVDVLDPRRSHMDDINLDRFEYFRLPKGDLLAVPPNGGGRHQQHQWAQSSSNLARQASLNQASSRSPEPTRAGLSYKRDYYFANLLDKASIGVRENYQTVGGQSATPGHDQQPSQFVYASKLFESWENIDEATNKYRDNNVARIYDLVMSRYKWCKKNLDGVDLGSSILRQQCEANGPLGDQAAQLGTPNALWTEDVVVSGDTNNKDQLALGRQRLEATQDRCAFYRRGLDPWAEGLIKQDLLSAQLIQHAKC